jgi:hypothetical protein
MAYRYLLPVLLLLPFARSAPTEPPASADELVRQLGAESFADREAAEAGLIRHPDAGAALYQARDESTNPEVRGRVDRILTARRALKAEEQLKQLPQLVRQGQVDRVIELVTAYRARIAHPPKPSETVKGGDSGDIPGPRPAGVGPPRDNVRKLLVEFTDRVYAAAEKQADRKVRRAAFDRDDHCGWYVSPQPKGYEYRWFTVCVDSFETRAGFHDQMVFSRGPVTAPKIGGSCFSTVICVNDDTKLSHFNQCLVVVNGDLDVGNGGAAVDSVIICSGSVTGCLYRAERSIVIALGTITLEEGSGQYKDCTFLPGQKALGQPFQFFSSSDVGLELDEKENALTVRAIRPGSPSAAAGIKKGDVLLAIDGESIPTAQKLNRLLCRASVTTGEAVIKLRRDNEVRYHVIRIDQ